MFDPRVFDPRTGSHVHDFIGARCHRQLATSTLVLAGLAAAALALAVTAAGLALAAPLPPAPATATTAARGHRLVVCPPPALPGAAPTTCHDLGRPRTSRTACLLDLAGESLIAPTGTRLVCVHEEPRR